MQLKGNRMAYGSKKSPPHAAIACMWQGGKRTARSACTVQQGFLPAAWRVSQNTLMAPPGALCFLQAALGQGAAAAAGLVGSGAAG